MKKRNMFWGIFFIAAAVFLIMSRLGYVTGVNIGSFFFGVLFAAWFIKSLIKLDITGIFFSVAFLCIVFANPLGITNLTPWPVLGAACLGSIGCSFLFPKKRNSFDFHHGGSGRVEYDDKENIYCNCKFSGVIKYVTSENFKKADLDCSFGGLKVYFDNAQISGNQAEINANVSFGGIELYLPRQWNVIHDADVMLGGIEEKNRMQSPDGPTVYLTGNLKFSGITIIYV